VIKKNLTYVFKVHRAHVGGGFNDDDDNIKLEVVLKI
jgi:hypothetical protein